MTPHKETLEELTLAELCALMHAARDRESLRRIDGSWDNDYETTDLIESALCKLRARHHRRYPSTLAP